MGDIGASEVVSTGRGSLIIAFHAPHLLHVIARGHYGKELLLPYMRAIVQTAETGCAIGFHDWLDMTGYDSECRTRMTDWTIQNRTRIASGHILVRHRLVAMGVAASSLLVGKNLVTTYTERAPFEAALRQAREAPPPTRSSFTSITPPKL